MLAVILVFPLAVQQMLGIANDKNISVSLSDSCIFSARSDALARHFSPHANTKRLYRVPFESIAQLC
jgi:hypothetical protein